MWLDGETRCYTLITLITATSTGPVEEILDYDYVDHLEQAEGVLVGHTRQREDVLVEADMTAAGVMLLQMWLTGDTKEDVVAREREIRSRIYRKPPRGLEYPDHWR